MNIVQNFLICLVGLPASGKSTLAGILKESMSEEFKDRKVKIIDPDLIRKSLAPDIFDHEQEKKVRDMSLHAILSELKEGTIVISDDLNYYSSMRHDLKEIADALQLPFFIIHVATPLKTCLKWNEKRGKKIPDEVIERVHKKFDLFNKYQWDRPFYVVNLSNTIDIDKKNHANEIIARIIIILNGSKLERGENGREKTNITIEKQKLEIITRRTVGMLLKNTKNLSVKDEILDLRKKFIKDNLIVSLSESKIAHNLIKFLEEELNQKLS